MATLNPRFNAIAPARPRSARRLTLRLSALAVSPADGSAERVELLNLSERGFLLHSQGEFARGDILEITLPEAGPVEAEVVWDNAPQFGCQFITPLPRAAVSASVLRAPALQAMVTRPAPVPARQPAQDPTEAPLLLTDALPAESPAETRLSPRARLAIGFSLAVLCWTPIIAVVALLRA